MKLPTLVLFTNLAACACGRDAVAPDPAPDVAPDAARVDETDATKRALVDDLVADGHPGAKIHVDVSPGALGTTRIHTRVDDAYPGDGLRTALIADGRRYGLGSRDLADLARARKWHEAPPPAADLAPLVVFAWLPTMGVDSDVPMQLGREGDGLLLLFGAREIMSGDGSLVVARMPLDGPARIELAHPERPPPSIPDDPVAALEQALASGEAMPMMAALRRMDAAPPSPARTRALARAAVLPNDAIAFDALLRIGASDDSAAALLDAVKSLDDPGARPRLVERARQVLGEAFARRLAR